MKRKSLLIFLFSFFSIYECNPELGKVVTETLSDAVFLSCLTGQTSKCETSTLSVVSITPDNGSANISSSPTIKIIFNQTVVLDSVSIQSSSGVCSGSVQISKDDFSTCAGLTSNQDSSSSEYSFSTSPSLVLNATYKVKVTTAVKTLYGKTLSQDYVQKDGFSTSSIVDTTPPTIGSAINFSGINVTSLNVNWGAGTDDITALANLQYKVVKDDTSSANISTIVLAETKTGADLLMDWTANVTTFAVTGLSPSTNYHFVVLVRDAAHNKAIYVVSSQTTTNDVTSPTVGTGITFSSVADTSMTVNWGQATDDATGSASLQYKLVKDNTSTANINTIAAANAKAGADLLMDWAANTLTYNVTALSPSSSYHFAVLVKDSAGNISLYTPATQATSADVIAPSFAGVTTATPNGGTFVTLNWTAGSDNVTIPANLVYDICVSTSSGTCQTTFTVNSTSTAGATSHTVSSLTPNTSYYFLVRARDQAGNRDGNTTERSATTPVENIYTNISFTNILADGWSICMQEDYSAPLNLSSIFASCTQTNLMLACRLTGDSTVILAAYGATSDVTFDTGVNSNVVHSAGGVNWYFNASQAWGFTLGSEPVNKNSCDIETSVPEKRLCWHAASSGWRCGAATGLSGNNYERLILQKN
ncbi:fibronectin type III domain-containing protein [Leptospira idonii]|nr:fibronectin type III domain-containing protein [Leptospira idonii]